MKIQKFQDLDVFKLAYKVSLEIHEKTKTFPKDEQFGLTSQIRRSSKSICANIAEGFGKQISSGAEFKRYLSIAKGSAEEMQLWIMYCRDCGYINDAQKNEWAERYDHISKMLYKLHKAWK